MNSLLQSLLCISSFSHEVKNYGKKRPNGVTRELMKLIGTKSRSQLQQLRSVIMRLSDGQFTYGKQEDSHELFRFLFEQLHAENSNKLEKFDSP